jgi:hypothetical protein
MSPAFSLVCCKLKMPHRSKRVNAHRQWSLAAARAISEHFHAGEYPVAMTVVTANDAGMMITYTLRASTAAVERAMLTDPEKLMLSASEAFVPLKHGESGD